MLDVLTDRKNVILATLVGVLIVSFFFSFISNVYVALLMSSIIGFSALFFKAAVWDRSVVFLLSFCVVQMLYMMLGNGTNFNLLLLVELEFLTSVFLSNCLKFFTVKQLRLLFVLFVGLYSFSIFRTLFILQIDPMAVRHFGYGAETFQGEEAYVSLVGMLSYGVGEALCFILPAFFCFVKNTKSLLIKLLMLLLVVIGIYTQYLATLTTSFFLSILGCTLAFVFSMNDVGSKKSLIMILVVVVVVVVIYPLLSFEENVQFMTKIDDVTYSISTGKTTGQAGYRLGLYAQSISVFLNNPLLGLGHWPAMDLVFMKNDISIHTAMFDYLGLYGMFVLFLFCSWKNCIQKSFGLLSENQRKYYASSFISLIMLLILKGPVSIGIDFLFSTVMLGIIYRIEVIRTENILSNE